MYGQLHGHAAEGRTFLMGLKKKKNKIKLSHRDGKSEKLSYYYRFSNI